MPRCSCLADTGLTSGAQRSYYDYDDDQEADRRATLFTGLLATMTVALAFMVALLALAVPISSWAFGTASHASLVRLVGITIPLGTLGSYAREAMRLKFRAVAIHDLRDARVLRARQSSPWWRWSGLTAASPEYWSEP